MALNDHMRGDAFGCCPTCVHALEGERALWEALADRLYAALGAEHAISEGDPPYHREIAIELVRKNTHEALDAYRAAKEAKP